MTFSQVLLGIGTGIPVMIMVGPVSLLLIEQGMKHGFRGGMPAAVGVGATDLTFSVAAAVTGAAAARVLEPAQAVLHLVAFAVLAWLAAVTWRAARRDLLHLDGPIMPRAKALGTASSEEPVTTQHMAFRTVPASPAVAAVAHGGELVPAVASASDGRAVRGGDSWLARAAAFSLITAANPITIVVFASLVVSGREGIGSPGWVIGMTFASVLVSTAYLAVGHGLGAVLSEMATARLRLGGAVVLLALGAWFAFAG
jgi:threonine/homoserine/homoserine lactone efflux protein